MLWSKHSAAVCHPAATTTMGTRRRGRRKNAQHTLYLTVHAAVPGKLVGSQKKPKGAKHLHCRAIETLIRAASVEPTVKQ